VKEKIMNRQEAIVEERRRYVAACRALAADRAHIHLMALHRLCGNGYCVWERHADRAG
jgi:hypothetical protein